MKVSLQIQLCLSKIVKKQGFVKDILQSIMQQGGKVLLVGGAVRDLLLKKQIKDLDFEVYGLTLSQLELILGGYGTVSLIGKSFGVLRLHGIDIDWSLPRKDSSGRHPQVEYDPYMSYEQAFIRRDLTINAMGIDMHTFELIDVYQGLSDLHHKVLQAPDLKFFVQDPLRLLRVMQFVGRFEMHVDPALSDACKTIDLSKVSQERVEQEFVKLLLQSRKPSLGLQWLIDIGRFHDYFPDIQPTESMLHALDCAADQAYVSDEDKLACMWAIIFASLSDSRRPVAQAYLTDIKPIIDALHHITRYQKLIDKVVRLVWYVTMLHHDITDAQLQWIAYWLSPHVSLRLLFDYAMMYHAHETIDLLRARAQALQIIDEPIRPLLMGKDLLGSAQGKELGNLVKKAYQIQIDQNIQDVDQLKKLL